MAVLEDALLVIRSHGSAWKRRSARPRYVAEARAWLASDAGGDPFTASAVCESLGLSLDAIRRAVADAEQRPGWHHPGRGGASRRLARG